MFKLKIGLDVDDVLFSCTEYAIDLLNADEKYDPPIQIEEVFKFGKTGTRTDGIHRYFGDPDFYKSQPLLPGAKEFVYELSRRAEVFFNSATPPHIMGIRAQRLIEEFPWIPSENIILGTKKDVVSHGLDIILDDGAHNVVASNATFPVLFRQPWNRNMTGCLAVNSYEDFLAFVDVVRNGYSMTRGEKGNKLYVLVGPSASGKTDLINMCANLGYAVKNKSYTTRTQRSEEDADDYFFCTEEEFQQLADSGELCEQTIYAGKHYGTSRGYIAKKLKTGTVIMAADICGAIALKREFPQETVTVFVKRPKEDLIRAILDRNVSNEEKTKRIISLSDEYQNERICDAVIHNDGTIAEAFEQLKKLMLDYGVQ